MTKLTKSELAGYGYLRVGACVPHVRVGDVSYNLEQAIEMMNQALDQHVDLLVFPELSLTGYTCGDLFHNPLLIHKAWKALEEVARHTEGSPMAVVVGLPAHHQDALYNCAAFVLDGEICGIVPKSHLPNYKEFYEKRWFASGSRLDARDGLRFGPNQIFTMGEARIAIEICEDLWVPATPGSRAALAGANVVVNLSASNDLIGKHATLQQLIKQHSRSAIAGYVYASAGFGESTTDVVFGGKTIIAQNGSILAQGPRFSTEPQLTVMDLDLMALGNERRLNTSFHDNSLTIGDEYLLNRVSVPMDDDEAEVELLHPVKRHPFVPGDRGDLDARCEEIVSIQAMGLMQRLHVTGIQQVVVGISGGLDSTLALLVAVEAFDRLHLQRTGITGITMPGFGTTGRTHNNAMDLMRELGVTSKEISIVPAVNQHFADIEQDPGTHDVTYENCQARERTQILMDYANKIGALVLGTGDLSEQALGWATYNGDHMSMYNVNTSIPKTLVQHLVRWFAQRTCGACASTLHDVLATPISPELIPAGKDGEIKQKTEDLVGPYELHDFFLYYMIRHNFPPGKIFMLACSAFGDSYDDDTVNKWLTTFVRRFFNQQFKRSCCPDGPKVGSVSLSPRGDWRMPSDASSALWLGDISH